MKDDERLFSDPAMGVVGHLIIVYNQWCSLRDSTKGGGGGGTDR